MALELLVVPDQDGLLEAASIGRLSIEARSAGGSCCILSRPPRCPAGGAVGNVGVEIGEEEGEVSIIDSVLRMGE